jgi:ABC-type sugar transport system substrate-binding protein
LKRLIAMVVGLVVLSTAALAETPHTIAFSVKTVTNDDFQKAIATSIQDAVEKSGNKFLLVTAGEETGVSIQVNQVEDLIAKKVDAIILSPMDEGGGASAEEGSGGQDPGDRGGLVSGERQ